MDTRHPRNFIRSFNGKDERRAVSSAHISLFKNGSVPASRKAGEISEQAVREELEKILKSAIFLHSDRISRFLRFTVEAVLSGSADTLEARTR